MDITSLFPELTHDIKSAPNVSVGKYTFKVFSIGERGTTISPALMHEVVNGLIEQIREATDNKFDSIVSIHVTGAMWSLPVALALNKPLHLFTTEPSNIPGQQEFEQQRPYLPRTIYSPDLSKVGNCILIDDVLSGGGTLTQMKKAIEEAGGNVLGAFCVIDKNSRAEILSRELNMSVNALIDIQ